MSAVGVDLLDTSFLSGLSVADLILTVSNIADHLESHPAFQNAPEHVPGPPKLRQQVDDLTKVAHAIANGETHRKQELKDLQVGVERSVKFAAQHVVMVSIYKNDPTFLQNTGLEPKQRNYTRHFDQNVPAQPIGLDVKHSGTSGTVIVTVKSASDVVTRELQVALGEPSLETSWRTVGFYGKCKIVVSGLEPATRCHFRIRGVNDAGAGPWSATVALIIL